MQKYAYFPQRTTGKKKTNQINSFQQTNQQFNRRAEKMNSFISLFDFYIEYPSKYKVFIDWFGYEFLSILVYVSFCQNSQENIANSEFLFSLVILNFTFLIWNLDSFHFFFSIKTSCRVPCSVYRCMLNAYYVSHDDLCIILHSV